MQLSSPTPADHPVTCQTQLWPHDFKFTIKTRQEYSCQRKIQVRHLLALEVSGLWHSQFYVVSSHFCHQPILKYPPWHCFPTFFTPWQMHKLARRNRRWRRAAQPTSLPPSKGRTSVSPSCLPPPVSIWTHTSTERSCHLLWFSNQLYRKTKLGKKKRLQAEQD